MECGNEASGRSFRFDLPMRERILRQRIRFLLVLFIIGLVISSA